MSALLIGCGAVALLLQLAVVPLWLLPAGSAWGWLLVPLALLSTPHWSLIHEAIHGTLLRDRRWNDRCGRPLAVGYGVPFALLKTGHLLHHRYSRTARERTEVYDPAATTWAATAPGYYVRLFGGLYLAEVATVVLAVAPRAFWQRLARRMESPDSVTGILLDRVGGRLLRQFRVDAAAVVAVHAASLLAYGRHAWMLGAAIAARAVMISVADNAYHYGTELDAPLEAMNLRLPRVLETFVLAFNLHAVHHRHPGLRWHHLRAAFRADGDRFHLGWFTAVARQVRGPVPDERSGTGPPHR
ncbi:fatty acid desaturase family protein [Virgisporangium aurantiacum]|uniref:Fatty acid desaturase n=1 Tax=Virgisporangium aurantiacum TaxID=175570 RepID=A0A8J4DZN2_9ACTN|nr:fatty acid desaturase [Virgisporangium aurantiacum]GIJ54207.1 fatty acid desaturase [Virgisporangium aurantiacum]